MSVNSDATEKRIAIYGGTFDPIHLAHITLADYAVKELDLDELYFMPAFVSPFKQDKEVCSGEDRCGMISQALSYNPAFRLSNYELMAETPSYTYNTLTYWKSRIQGKLYFVLGMDSVVQIDTWYHGEDILREIALICDYSRPGTDSDIALQKIVEFRQKYNAEIHVIDMPPMDVSGTEVRNRVKAGLDISDLVLPEVEDYIIEHNLYK